MLNTLICYIVFSYFLSDLESKTEILESGGRLLEETGGRNDGNTVKSGL